MYEKRELLLWVEGLLTKKVSGLNLASRNYLIKE